MAPGWSILGALVATLTFVGANPASALDACPTGTQLVAGKTRLDTRLVGTLDKICPGGCPARWCAKATDEGRLIKHGPFASEHENGRRNAAGEYRDGKRYGSWAAWYEDGTPRYTGEWTDDQKSGPWTMWHENGTKQSEGEYRHNEMVGTWTFYHDNGRKAREGSYVNGQPSGAWKIWNDDGTLRSAGEIRTTIIVD